MQHGLLQTQDCLREGLPLHPGRTAQSLRIAAACDELLPKTHPRLLQQLAQPLLHAQLWRLQILPSPRAKGALVLVPLQQHARLRLQLTPVPHHPQMRELTLQLPPE